MGGAEGSYGGMVVPPPTPTVAPLNSGGSEEHKWQHYDDSVNAVSVGFVATAILISLFLVLAMFEKLLRQKRSVEIEPNGGLQIDLEEQIVFDEKLRRHPSQEVTTNGRGVLVLMPGEDLPTFIAHPAPCLQEPISWPLHHTLHFVPPLPSMAP